MCRWLNYIGTPNRVEGYRPKQHVPTLTKEGSHQTTSPHFTHFTHYYLWRTIIRRWKVGNYLPLIIRRIWRNTVNLPKRIDFNKQTNQRNPLLTIESFPSLPHNSSSVIVPGVSCWSIQLYPPRNFCISIKLVKKRIQNGHNRNFPCDVSIIALFFLPPAINWCGCYSASTPQMVCCYRLYRRRWLLLVCLSLCPCRENNKNHPHPHLGRVPVPSPVSPP